MRWVVRVLWYDVAFEIIPRPLSSKGQRDISLRTSRRAARLKTLRLWRRMRARGTTKLYDRTADVIPLDEVERIVIRKSNIIRL